MKVLAGFLAAMRPWAHDLAPKLAEPLADAVDRRLQISAPLGGWRRCAEPAGSATGL